MEERCHLASGVLGVGHLHIGHALGLRLRHVLAQHGLRPELYGLGDELVPVDLRALHGHEQMSRLHFSGVDVYSRDVYVHVADDGQRLGVLQQLLQFHIFMLYCYSNFSVQISPFLM